MRGMPLDAQERILNFLYSFDAQAFVDRLLHVMKFVDMRPISPWDGKTFLAPVPGIRALKAEIKFKNACARTEKRAIARSHKPFCTIFDSPIWKVIERLAGENRNGKGKADERAAGAFRNSA